MSKLRPLQGRIPSPRTPGQLKLLVGRLMVLSVSIIFWKNIFNGLRSGYILGTPKWYNESLSGPSRGDNCVHSSPYTAAVDKLVNGNLINPVVLFTGKRSQVKFVIGIPTVKRSEATLQSLLRSMSRVQRHRSLVVILMSEPDERFSRTLFEKLLKNFKIYFDSGLVDVVIPNEDFYPDLAQSVVPTYGDSVRQVRWRRKLVLDCVFLMLYAMTRGEYYLHTEDDLWWFYEAMPTMEQFVDGHTDAHYSHLSMSPRNMGAMGKLFRSSELSFVSEHLLKCCDSKPLDWLFVDLTRSSRYCLRADDENCKYTEFYSVHYIQNKLFKHLGQVSSKPHQLNAVLSKN